MLRLAPPHTAPHLDPQGFELQLEQGPRVEHRVANASGKAARGVADPQTPADPDGFTGFPRLAPGDAQARLRLRTGGRPRVLHHEIIQGRIDLDVEGVALGRAGRNPNKKGAVIGRETGDRGVIGPGGNLAPGRMPVLAVEMGASHDDIALDPHQAVAAQIRGQAPPILGIEGGVAAPPHADLAHDARGARVSIRAHNGLEAVARPQGVEDSQGRQQFHIRSRKQKPIGFARVKNRFASLPHNQRGDSGRGEGIGLQRPIQPFLQGGRNFPRDGARRNPHHGARKGDHPPPLPQPKAHACPCLHGLPWLRERRPCGNDSDPRKANPLGSRRSFGRRGVRYRPT